MHSIVSVSTKRFYLKRISTAFRYGKILLGIQHKYHNLHIAPKFPSFQTTQKSRASRFTINRHKISEKGCLKKPIFKAPLNKLIFLLFLLHDQEVMKKNTQEKLRI